MRSTSISAPDPVRIVVGPTHDTVPVASGDWKRTGSPPATQSWIDTHPGSTIASFCPAGSKARPETVSAVCTVTTVRREAGSITTT